MNYELVRSTQYNRRYNVHFSKLVRSTQYNRRYDVHFSKLVLISEFKIKHPHFETFCNHLISVNI